MKPLVLSPWLGVGFGKRAEIGILGDDSGVEDQSTNVMVELGLLLFQVGSGQPIDYGLGSLGVHQAKTRAVQALQTVRIRVSSAYANVVQGLLEWESVPSHLRTEIDADKDRTFVQDVLSALHKLERDLEGTIAVPLSSQTFPETRSQAGELTEGPISALPARETDNLETPDLHDTGLLGAAVDDEQGIVSTTMESA